MNCPRENKDQILTGRKFGQSPKMLGRVPPPALS